jgi:hypothetical protein
MIDENSAYEEDSVVFVVLEAQACWLANALDVDTATTLIALVSEDPGDWNEALDNWPRYRTPAVCEFASGLPFTRIERDAVIQAVEQTKYWVALDFPAKRIVTGLEFMPVGRDAALAMVVDESGDQHCPLSVHLPPWWELHEQVNPSVIDQPRQSPIEKPVVERDVLYGDVLLNDIASRVLATVASDAWLAGDAADNEQSHHRFTVEVHRDWLMTPREDLEGRMPRQLLHGARAWTDHVVWAQRLRFEDGAPMVAASCDVADYETAPMGSEEMVIYFNLCRELIRAGWFWCAGDEGRSLVSNNKSAQSQLVEFLQDAKEDWLSSPFEGGSPPRFIIECSRRRVPRGAGVPIVGMTDQQSEQHMIDCDCPICQMMADGMFGVGFTSLDGHHLDLDDEFAFSMHETREAWEEMLREFEEMSAAIEKKNAEREAASESENDLFASAWTGMTSDESIPGDSTGNLKLAFLLSEIVSFLQTQDAHREIERLNAAFTDYRRCEPDDLAATAERLRSQLQSLADLYPELVSKSSDFQSRLDEQSRAPTWSNDEFDFPF